MNRVICGWFLWWCSPPTLVGRLHHIVIKCRIRPVAQIGMRQYDPSLPRTTSWDGLTNSSSTSQTFLIVPSTKKLAIQLKHSEVKGVASPKSNGHYASSNHCRESGTAAEILWVRLRSIIAADLLTLVESRTC